MEGWEPGFVVCALLRVPRPPRTPQPRAPSQHRPALHSGGPAGVCGSPVS